MFRYIALIWDNNNTATSEAAQLLEDRLTRSNRGWTTAFRHDGLAVHCQVHAPAADRVYVLEDQRGVVLGCLFDTGLGHEPPRVLDQLDASRTREIIGSRGRALIMRYFGRYVAFLRSHDGGRKWVIRDPTGGLNCFHSSFRGVEVFFSDMTDCEALNLLRFSVNRTFVAVNILRPMGEARETGLNEVTRVMGGECATVLADKTTNEFYWNPFDVAAADTAANASDAAQEIRRTVRLCTDAWASVYDRILHTLSGGVDSSIVLACLGCAPSRPDITCINYRWSSEPATDERHFARISAADCRRDLRCVEVPVDIDLLDSLPRAPHPLPYTFMTQIAPDAVRREVSRDLGIQALFGGLGGDELFYHSDEELALADRIRAHPLSLAVIAHAYRVSRIKRASIYSTLRQGFRASRSSTVLNDLLAHSARYMSLIPQEWVHAATTQKAFLHPWLAAAENVPPGKLMHILMLTNTYQTHAPYASQSEPDTVHPLLSQPLIELCLRIPTYLHMERSWNRILERRAFADIVPGEIIWRSDKSVQRESVARLVEANARLVREYLLGGLLREEHLVVSSELEAMLRDATSRRSSVPKILFAFSTELWLRNWSASNHLRAAA